MSMTVAVTRNAPGRVRGFLTSAMAEIAPGVYVSPRMSPAVRERIWEVLVDWFEPQREQAVVLTWPDPSLPGGQAVRTLGSPRTDLVDHDGVFLARRDLNLEQEARVVTPS